MALRPRVSIVTPSYNHSRFIQERVDSVLGQTFGDFEWIIVDDASWDGSAELYREMTDGDPRVTVTENAVNLGMRATTNLAISKIRGEHVVRAESDDSFAEDFIARLHTTLASSPEIDVAFGRTLTLDSDRRISGGRLQGRRKRVISPHQALRVLLRRNFISGPSAMVRSRVFREVGPFGVSPISVACDWHFYLRCAALGRTFAYEPGAVAYHRSHGGNLSGLVSRAQNPHLLVTESLFLVTDALRAADYNVEERKRRQIYRRIATRYVGAEARRMRLHDASKYEIFRRLAMQVDPRWRSDGYAYYIESQGFTRRWLGERLMRVISGGTHGAR